MIESSRAIAILAVAAVSSALAFGATAADLQPLPPAPVGTSWSGFYVGGNLGAAFDPNDPSIKDLSAEQDLSLKFSNETELMGGAQAGYNWQMGGWVVGLEGDFDFAKNINYLASARGRVGWALGSWLPYATAGVAFIDANMISRWFPPTMAPSVSTPAVPTRGSSLVVA